MFRWSHSDEAVNFKWTYHGESTCSRFVYHSIAIVRKFDTKLKGLQSL